MKILITGSGSGIALSLAFYLAKYDNFIYVTTHDKKQVKIVKEKIEEKRLTNKITCFKLDINNKKDCDLINKIDIDCLVNNASIPVGGSIIDLSDKEIINSFTTNVFSNIRLIKTFLKKPNLKNKKRTVLITSSLIGIMPLEFLGVYSATKASLISMMTSLKYELKNIDKNIKIRLIEPGAYHTGFNDFMIDKVEESINESSFFYEKKDKIVKKLKFIFNLIEKKSTSSIVRKMKKAIDSNSNKLIYRSPFLQVIGTKLYALFLK